MSGFINCKSINLSPILEGAAFEQNSLTNSSVKVVISKPIKADLQKCTIYREPLFMPSAISRLWVSTSNAVASRSSVLSLPINGFAEGKP